MCGKDPISSFPSLKTLKSLTEVGPQQSSSYCPKKQEPSQHICSKGCLLEQSVNNARNIS